MSQRRVLLARIKDEARDVHVCRRATAVQGSLQPLLGLAHSIISHADADEGCPGSSEAPQV